MGILSDVSIFSFVCWFYANTNYTLVDFTVTHKTEEGEIRVPWNAVSPNPPLALTMETENTRIF